MERQIHVIVLILLSIFEVWMCYQVLYRTALEKKCLRKWKQVLIWGIFWCQAPCWGSIEKSFFSLVPCLYSSFYYAALCLDCREKEYAD